MPWESAALCLVCPLCNSRLARRGASLVCASSHTFDIARDGYVHLLPTTRRAPRSVGDSKEMLRARRAFLSRGHFALCSDAINALVASHLTAKASKGDSETINILDVGCGEGYFLDRLRLHLLERLDQPITYHGVDIAKDAARLAARRSAELHVAVADVTARLPYAAGAFETLLNVFAPRNPAEFARLLVSAGLLAVVIPTQQRLRELRAIAPLLGIEEDKQQRVVARLARFFALVDASELEYDIELDSLDVINLVQMTPSARHLPPKTLEGLREQMGVHTRLGFTLIRFLRT
jgi:23S rRNA (guanine745-N1)-methyltransferase